LVGIIIAKRTEKWQVLKNGLKKETKLTLILILFFLILKSTDGKKAGQVLAGAQPASGLFF